MIQFCEIHNEAQIEKFLNLFVMSNCILSYWVEHICFMLQNEYMAVE
jgi:hypothetical protein